MGTKQLQADKRVEAVTLNDAGKADTLTLKPGWAFEGSRGPFKLTNVEHGHRIVRGAAPDGSAPVEGRAPRKPKDKPDGPQRVARGAVTDPDNPDAPSRPDLPPYQPRTELITFCYRTVLCPKGEEPKGQGREYCGWLARTEELSKSELEKRTWDMLGGYIKGDKKSYEVKSRRWFNEDQTEARRKEELGAPFKDQNFGSKKK